MVTAGGPAYGPLLEMDPAQVRNALSDHIVLGLEVTRNAAGKMRPGRTLVLIGGTGGRRVGHGLGIASAATAALPPFAAALALELAPVRVNLIAAGFEAERLAGLHGWSPRTLSLVLRGLRILLAIHGPGEQVRASTIRQLTARTMPFPHIADVLAAVGVLDDDRPDTLATWLDEQLAGLPAQIRAELGAWLDVRRHGGPRRRPRSRQTIVRDVRAVRRFLAEACCRCSTLRQVTRDDITTWLASRPGHTRTQDASTLRSLFGTLKAERLIFANPARGVRVSRRNPSVPAPLPAHLLTDRRGCEGRSRAAGSGRAGRGARAAARPDPPPAP
jgi:hypothetical protein